MNPSDIFNYLDYAEKYHKISTKVHGIQPLRHRVYQKKFVQFVQEIKGPKRVAVVKPRQAGFTTLPASMNVHSMKTIPNFKGIALADQFSRTKEVVGIYRRFVDLTPHKLLPMIAINNSEEILFDNPSREDRSNRPGLNSGVIFGTANDSESGRAGTRMFFHLTEFAFYLYAAAVLESVQNSVPLSPLSFGCIESTSNGRQGTGQPFFDLWEAAERGETIYKPFFVAWFEVDDYCNDPGMYFIPTKEEHDLLKFDQRINHGHLAWRRLKISEYASSEDSLMAPDERFKQDFPSFAKESFLFTGSPVFDPIVISKRIDELKANVPACMKHRIKIPGVILNERYEQFRIYLPPRPNKNYYVSADISEGLAIGDSSSVHVCDDEGTEIAWWHGKIDPDLLGHMLIELSVFFNNALINPENNNMGHTTVTTVRNNGGRLYKKVIEDKVEKTQRTEYGWRTTEKSKSEMLNELAKDFRENPWKIKNVLLVQEMGSLSRGENGSVELNGKDRVVARCLALMALKHNRRPVSLGRISEEYGTAGDIHKAWEARQSRKSHDMFS